MSFTLSEPLVRSGASPRSDLARRALSPEGTLNQLNTLIPLGGFAACLQFVLVVSTILSCAGDEGIVQMAR